MNNKETEVPESKRIVLQILLREIGANEGIYCLLLVVYIASIFVRNIAWSWPSTGFGGTLQMYLTFITLLLLGLNIALILIPVFNRIPETILIVVLSAFIVIALSRAPRIWFEAFMAVFLILTAYGKKLDRLMWIFLWSCAVSIGFAGIGQVVGFVATTFKSGAYGTGLAFGISHPNIWGSYAFMILIVLWYRYFQEKMIVSFGVFWAMALFMVFIVKCRTIALLVLAFPVLWVLHRYVAGLKGRCKSILKWVLILLPVLCFILTFVLGLQREALVRYTFGTYIENFSKRFIQAGLAFHEHGIPLIGENIHFNMGVHEVLNGKYIALYVMDNGYATYWIERGAIWMVFILTWLCLANRKAVREKNYALLLISTCMSLSGLMERYGLDVWYNFILLYPLALGNGQIISDGAWERTESITGEKDYKGVDA